MKRIAAKIVSKLQKLQNYWTKTTSLRHCSGALERCERRSRFAQKSHNWWHIMVVWLWHENRNPIIPMKIEKKIRQVRSNVKVWLTVFFDCNGVIHHEFLSQGRTVFKNYYVEVIRRLCEKIRWKCTELWKKKIKVVHHDNAPDDCA